MYYVIIILFIIQSLSVNPSINSMIKKDAIDSIKN